MSILDDIISILSTAQPFNEPIHYASKQVYVLPATHKLSIGAIIFGATEKK